jgi:hypothetical protein
MKKILEILKHKWAEYLLEIAVIMIGILGAFSLNTWNDNRLEMKLEEKLLEALRKEIRININNLNLSIKRQSASLNATKTILNHFGNWNKTVNKVNISIDSLSIVSMIPWTFNPQMGVTKSIISNGEIKSIRNHDIVLFLSSFEDRIKDVTEAEIRLIGNNDNLLRPRLYQYIRALSVVLNIDVVKSDNTLPASQFQSNIIGFLGDAELENMFMEAYNTQLNILQEQREIMTYFESMLDNVNSELEN